MKSYKPENYNSLSPYLIVDDAERLVSMLKEVFYAKELRMYKGADGRIFHGELLIDDTVVMISNSTENYPAHKMMLHVYVSGVDIVFKRAIDAGCVSIEAPVIKEGDTDKRGSFYDFAGNFWSVSTQSE